MTMRKGLLKIMRVQGGINGHHDRFVSMLDRVAVSPPHKKSRRQRKSHAKRVHSSPPTQPRVPKHAVAPRFRPDGMWADSVERGKVMVTIREEGMQDLPLRFRDAYSFFVASQAVVEPTDPQYHAALDHVLSEVLGEDGEEPDIDGPLDGLQMTKRLMHHGPRRRNQVINYDS